MTSNGPAEARSIFSGEVADVNAHIQRALDEETLLEASRREAQIANRNQDNLSTMQRRRFVQLCAAGTAVLFARPIISIYDKPVFQRYEVVDVASRTKHDAINNLAENVVVSNEPEIAYSDEKVSIDWLPSTVTYWSPYIEYFAKQHNLDPNLSAILIAIESSGNPFARSIAGAQGLGQIMPKTQHVLMVLYHKAPANMFEPLPNLDYMATLLDELVIRYSHAAASDEELFIKSVAADYNAGYDVGQLVLRGGIPPAAETRHYIEYAWGMWQERKAKASAMYQKWLDDGGQGQVDRAYIARADFPEVTF